MTLATWGFATAGRVLFGRGGVASLGEVVKHHRFMGTRATVRERAAQTALDMLRRHLAGLPIDPAWD